MFLGLSLQVTSSYDAYIRSGLAFHDSDMEWMLLLPDAQHGILDFIAKLLNSSPLLVEEIDVAVKHDFLTPAETFLNRSRVKEIFDLETALAMKRDQETQAGRIATCGSASESARVPSASGCGRHDG